MNEQAINYALELFRERIIRYSENANRCFAKGDNDTGNIMYDFQCAFEVAADILDLAIHGDFKSMELFDIKREGK